MLSKCVNPSCSAIFRYLHDGRLFRLEAEPRLRNSNLKRLEYFWLCKDCSQTMSLRLDDHGKVSSVPASDRGGFGRNGIKLIDRRDGLLLSRLDSHKTGHGTGAVFFG
jgi:hypothetical protein